MEHELGVGSKPCDRCLAVATACLCGVPLLWSWRRLTFHMGVVPDRVSLNGAVGGSHRALRPPHSDRRRRAGHELRRRCALCGCAEGGLRHGGGSTRALSQCIHRPYREHVLRPRLQAVNTRLEVGANRLRPKPVVARLTIALLTP